MAPYMSPEEWLKDLKDDKPDIASLQSVCSSATVDLVTSIQPIVVPTWKVEEDMVPGRINGSKEAAEATDHLSQRILKSCPEDESNHSSSNKQGEHISYVVGGSSRAHFGDSRHIETHHWYDHSVNIYHAPPDALSLYQQHSLSTPDIPLSENAEFRPPLPSSSSKTYHPHQQSMDQMVNGTLDASLTRVAKQHDGSVEATSDGRNSTEMSLSPGDVVIAIMGITGCGKSSFIQKLSDQKVIIGHDLKSCTVDIGIYSFMYKYNKRVYLIDTPGFNDTYRSNTDVLKIIAHFFSMTYKLDIHLAGIVYLHRITDPRLTSSAQKNLRLFETLCGKDVYKNIVLVTTMWEKLKGHGSLEAGEKREIELFSKEKLWGIMHDGGSSIMRHTNDQESAMGIIDQIFIQYHSDHSSKVVLDIQKQMVDENKSLEDTSAGQEARKALLEMKQKCLKNIEILEEEHKAALAKRDGDTAKTIVADRAEAERKLHEIDKEERALKVKHVEISDEIEHWSAANSIFSALSHPPVSQDTE